MTKAGDLPLMAAVWADGRTLPGQDEGFEMTGRAARLTCRSCQAFPSDSWSSTAESVLGLRMEVRHSQQMVSLTSSAHCESDLRVLGWE